ncbi:DUF2917 domain-containing protein [Acidovorax sp.]|uniref:DUF2917 domain-containing protein n=1 Tax=Acidovorax sp. TaxID=1872122 RepID=UPI00260589B6|nr:DUF2917 domain-containing protein [Acidovorax sp.]
MTTSQSLHLFSSSSRAVGAPAGGLGAVAPGTAVRLAPKAAMALRISEGQAWVTLGNGLGDNSDLFLCAGQTLDVAAGQSVVMEPLGDRRVQFRWARPAAEAGRATWWRRASFGGGAPAQGTWGDACCA